MNPFLLPPKQRLAHWTAFRRGLANLPDAERLGRVATYFTQAPLMTIAYDPERPETWPSPWEMISKGDWCRSSIAIGMEMTLRVGGMDPERTELRMVIAPEIEAQRLLLLVDRCWTLNYLWGYVTDDLGPHRVLGRWRHRGRAYHSITD